MIKIDVMADVERAKRDLRSVFHSAVPAAAASALNRTASTARTVAVRTIRGQTAIKASEVRRYVLMRRAARTNLVATITAKAHAPNLIRYGAREVRGGVSANAWGKRRIYKDAFIGNKGRTVFGRVNPTPPKSGPRRIGRHQRRAHFRTRNGRSFPVVAHPVGNGPKAKRGPIKALFGPSIRREFVRDVCNTAMLKSIRERWPVEFARELSFRINKLASRFGL